MNLPIELSGLVVAALIIAISLFAFALAALRSERGDRAPFWFGVYGCLYGIRLAARSDLIQPLLPGIFWLYLDAFINYAIIAPAVLFVGSLLGPGSRLGSGSRPSLRRIGQAAAGYALLAMANDLLRGRPGATMWLNPPVVLAAGGIVIVHLLVFRRWGSWPREFRVVIFSGILFLVVAALETVHVLARVEHFAMMLFMATVGYAVLQRMLVTERRFAAVSRELEIAREIQRSILPASLPETRGLRVAACYLPMSEVGGDFYDFDSQRPKGLGLIVADVSGHGVPAALVASMVKMGFAAEAERHDQPGLVLKNINRMLCGKFAGAFVSASCAFIDRNARKIYYASAGHPAPLLRRRDGRIEALSEGGLLLAIDAGAEYVTAEVRLGQGDRLLFFSDGLVEARDSGDEFFGSERLERLLAVHAAAVPDLLIEQVIIALRSWVGPGASLQDDVTAVVVDIEGE
ncbi:MAG: SpoIIE family protein phosphatase [Candidatus Aminicenantes bacterium]|nr:SpoIIE family protein phosphatase [Candidatus Aminicenantes bacterium]